MPELAGRFWFRLAVACAFVVLQLALVTAAGHDRLGLPFNSSPDAVPIYTRPNAGSVTGTPRQPRHWSRLIVSRWDAQHYIGYGLRGLETCPDHADAPDAAFLACGLAWLPIYGLAGGAIARVTGIPVDYTLLLISVLAAIAVNLLWTCRALRDRLGAGGAYGALVAFNLFPTAFYMVVPYTEATTLAFVLAGLICLLDERWLLAGIAIGAATALRSLGIVCAFGLSSAALLAAWRGRKGGVARWWRPLLAIPLSVWGLAIQLLVFRAMFGDAFVYNRAHFALPGTHGSFLHLIDGSYYIDGFTAQHRDSVMIFGAIAIIAFTWRRILARLKLEALVFLLVTVAATLAIAIGTNPGYWGINRYLLLCPGIFIGAGIMARENRGRFIAWLVVCAIMYWSIELCSYVAQGDPKICPCMGPVEFTLPFRS